MNYLKKVLLYVFCSWYRKNNRIIIHKKNGQVIESFGFWGLTVVFKGKNSRVEIYEPIKFLRRFLCNRSKIRIVGNDNHIVIKSTKHKISNLKIVGVSNNNNIEIDENFYQSGLCVVDFCNLDNMKFKIGKDCMFGQNVEFMLGDWHSLFDEKGNCTNFSKCGIEVGDHVWIARNVVIMKDVLIPNGSVVGLGSVVTKRFDDENILVAGIPAKVLKHNIKWSHKNPK